ncbi:MAG: amidohydrolase family protein [Phycisphaerales bacterium]|nr:amidohydrolase family protein [Phycisphaerales bacterium]
MAWFANGRGALSITMRVWLALTAFCILNSAFAFAQTAVRAKTLYTMSGPPIQDGIVIMRDGKIVAVGPAATTPIPAGARVLEAAVATPGLIDAHSTVGLSGILNYAHDRDQIEHSEAIQPELRAIDAYNCREKLIEFVRSFGVTTIHTGHAPGELISGQTMIVKTVGDNVAEVTLVESAAIACTLGPAAQRGGGAPGTRGKMMAMLREQFIKAQEYVKKQDAAEADKKPDRNLRLEALGRALRGEIPLMVTAYRAQDIISALRLANEFNIKLWLDGAAEAYMVIDEIKAAGVPVILHPSMMRASGDAENMSFETAAKLRKSGITVVLQSGYEDYVPKARVILFEAAIAAANGLTFDEALRAITIDSARLLGVDKRVGSLEAGKDGDIALFDGDPFEYTTHCIGVAINGQIVSETKR